MNVKLPLARKMGYKGITEKLRKAVEELRRRGKLIKVIAGNTIKLSVAPSETE